MLVLRLRYQMSTISSNLEVRGPIVSKLLYYHSQITSSERAAIVQILSILQYLVYDYYSYNCTCSSPIALGEETLTAT